MVEIQQIWKKYHKKSVLNGLDLKIREGSCVGIVGRNGSGKSTLLSILAGVQRADKGSFLCNGVDLFCQERPRRQLVGYVPQGTPLMEELTAQDNLRLWYKKKDLQMELSDGVLAMLGISDIMKIPVKKLSGGMKKRLSIACAVASHPGLLLMDEPFAALDLNCKEQIGAYLQTFRTKGGSILLAAHDMQELSLCDEWYILKDGVLEPYRYDGNIHQLAVRL